MLLGAEWEDIFYLLSTKKAMASAVWDVSKNDTESHNNHNPFNAVFILKILNHGRKQQQNDGIGKKNNFYKVDSFPLS